jgi:hypothetical protein
MVLALVEPLTLATLQKLWKDAFDDDGLDHILPYMTSLFSAINEGSPIHPIHTSGQDFFTDKSHNEKLSVDLNRLHYPLSCASIQVLQVELQFNICGLKTSNIWNGQIPNFKEMVEGRISSQLVYSSQYLGYHLQNAIVHFSDKERDSLCISLQTLLQRQVLYWLETLGLLQKIDRALLCLTAIQVILKVWMLNIMTIKLASWCLNPLKALSIGLPLLHSLQMVKDLSQDLRTRQFRSRM